MEHNDCNFSNRGFVINKKFSFLGASPDGIVNCSCHGKHLVEVKFPYRCCTKGLQEVAKDLSVFLKDNDGTLELDTSHAYYYQVQCQLGISEVENVTSLFGLVTGYKGSHMFTNAQHIAISLSATLMSAPSALIKLIGR